MAPGAPHLQIKGCTAQRHLGLEREERQGEGVLLTAGGTEEKAVVGGCNTGCTTCKVGVQLLGTAGMSSNLGDLGAVSCWRL